MSHTDTHDLAGRVQTVLGPLEPARLGVTMCHEHLLWDGAVYFGPSPERPELADAPLTLETLSWVRDNWFANRENTRLDDVELASAEARRYREAGGATLVDVTTDGIGRDPAGLARVAAASGVNVVMGCGWYVEPSHPAELTSLSEDELTGRIVADLTEGAAGTGVRAGVIGEIGCSIPLAPAERRVLRAAARAQALTGAPISVHPSRDDALVLEIVEILCMAGADPRHVVIGHVDSSGFGLRTRHALAEAGCFLEYDCFGYTSLTNGRTICRPGGVQILSDVERIRDVAELVAAGYGDRVLLSHDIFFRHMLTRYGGHGYAHILEKVVPLMRDKGLDEHAVHALLVENPRCALTFSAPRRGVGR